MKNKKSAGVVMAVAVLLLVIILLDAWVMLGQLKQQTRDTGIYQLECIGGELEAMIDDAEKLTTEIAIEAREYLDDRKVLEKFIRKKKNEISKGDAGVFNVYIASPDWTIITDFEAPDDYVATERLWYTGAIKNKGKVYVTSPYQDAVTGDICYSVSVMLGDGKTVLAVDYAMDTIQAYIEEMYEAGSHNAVVVTDEGVIAGCSDESLIGKSLTAALPEYAGIWALSQKTDDMASVRIKSGLLHDSIFAAKAGNGWNLIVSESDWEMFHGTYLQFLITILLAIALFVTVILGFVCAGKKGEETTEGAGKNKKKETIVVKGVNRRYRALILLFMVLVMVFSLYTNISATYKWGNAQLKTEAETYEFQLAAWIDTQKSILDMFVSNISTNPEMLKDYEGTIKYLDDITKQYPEISVTYLSNPKLDPSVYMNNGWKPGPEVRIEERPWYVGAINSEDGWNITAPYYDVQTGGYCITFSECVYDAKTREFIGVFGIDFYMDKLVKILGDSYSDKGYAFLVDTEGIIVNHPYEKYQMTEESQQSVLELPYGEVKANGEDTKIIRDYDGSRKILLAVNNDTSNFSVYVVYDAWKIYGRVVIYGILCLAAFLICIVLIYRLLSNMILWQEEINNQLKEAARTDAMTGLLNKASAELAISRAAEQGSGVLLIIDLDNFKLVNDLYGHEMGDRILIRFSELIRSVIRENDIAGRIGGDEFTVYCTRLMSGETITEKAEYLNREIIRSAREYMGSDMQIPLGCSIGAAMVPGAGREYGVLFSKADMALHQAKQGGKKGVRIHQDQEEAEYKESDGELSHLRMIFGERNRRKTAMVVDRDTFQSVYRYMMRFSSVCPWNISLVMFTLSAEAEEDLSEYTDRFLKMASKILRGSDVLMKHNSYQVIALLMDETNDDFSAPVSRVMKAWEQEGAPQVRISWEEERLDIAREDNR